MDTLLTDKALLDKIEAFIAKHEMRPSRFGLEAMGDGALIKQLRDGRSLSLRNAERVVRFMDEFEAQPTKAA